LSGENMDTDSRVKLAEIGGDIKRIFDFITRHATDVQRIDTRLNHHGERLTKLEASDNRSVGEQQGVSKTVKVMWAVMGGGGATILTGLAAIIARAKGL
jgi:hypothetical protein